MRRRRPPWPGCRRQSPRGGRRPCPGQVWDVTASDDVVLAAAHGSQARITALRADTGAELWSRTGDLATLAVVGIMGDTALLPDQSAPRRRRPRRLSTSATGVERWRRPVPTTGSLVQVAGHHVARHPRGRSTIPIGTSASTCSTPTTAASGPPSTAPTCAVRTHDVIVRDGATFDLYDIDTLTRLTHVALAEPARCPEPPSCGWPTPPSRSRPRRHDCSDDRRRRGRPPSAARRRRCVQPVRGGVRRPRGDPARRAACVVIEVVDGELREVWRRTGYVLDLEVDGAPAVARPRHRRGRGAVRWRPARRGARPDHRASSVVGAARPRRADRRAR